MLLFTPQVSQQVRHLLHTQRVDDSLRHEGEGEIAQAASFVALEGLFLAKLAFAIVLTVLSLDLNMRGSRAAKGGTPVDPAYARRSGMLMGVMSLLALISAVIIFN